MPLAFGQLYVSDVYFFFLEKVENNRLKKERLL